MDNDDFQEDTLTGKKVFSKLFLWLHLIKVIKYNFELKISIILEGKTSHRTNLMFEQPEKLTFRRKYLKKSWKMNYLTNEYQASRTFQEKEETQNLIQIITSTK